MYDFITYDLNTCPHMIWAYIVSAFFSLQIYDDHIWSLYMVWSHMIWTIVHIWFDYIWLPYMICGIWFATYDHMRDRHMIICRFWNMIPYMVDLSNHIRKSHEMYSTSSDAFTEFCITFVNLIFTHIFLIKYSLHETTVRSLFFFMMLTLIKRTVVSDDHF